MDSRREKIPCCAADALRQIRRIDVGGTVIGFTMLDAVFTEVAAMGIGDDTALGKELVRRAREHNYIPPGAETLYATALVREFHADRRPGSCDCCR